LGLNKKNVENQLIPMPSKPEQQKIADFLSVVDEKINKVEGKLTKAQTFKKGLLQQMFV
ncbi:restriction endonuclease subunit S, partial [Bacteroidota bacterium]|nr:restriction endonuclease subunit S [Bacteroidota bacterium]